MRGRKRFFCSSDPNSMICLRPPIMLPTMILPGPGMRQNCSTTMQPPVAPIPMPPYSFGTGTAVYPFSLILLNISQGNSLLHRAVASLGITSSANVSSSSYSFFCSSVHHGKCSI